MKKLIGTTFALLIAVGISASASAQVTEGDMSVGAGIAYGTDLEEIGIQANGTYGLNEEMRVGADVIYWLIEDHGSASTTFFEINANFHYIFHTQDDLMVYGLGTLGIHYAKIDSNIDVPGVDTSYSDTELGLGVGIGAEYNLGGVALFGEPRLFLSGFDQFAIAVGARVGI